MAFIFFSDGKVVGADLGSVKDPEAYIKNHKLPEGTTWKEVEEEKVYEALGPAPNRGERLPDPIEDQVKSLRARHEALIGIVEKTFKIQKGEISAQIDSVVKKEGG